MNKGSPNSSSNKLVRNDQNPAAYHKMSSGAGSSYHKNIAKPNGKCQCHRHSERSSKGRNLQELKMLDKEGRDNSFNEATHVEKNLSSISHFTSMHRRCSSGQYTDIAVGSTASLKTRPKHRQNHCDHRKWLTIKDSNGTWSSVTDYDEDVSYVDQAPELKNNKLSDHAVNNRRSEHSVSEARGALNCNCTDRIVDIGGCKLKTYLLKYFVDGMTLYSLVRLQS
ncbi:hypothetical protein BIW11_13756 [Tropilaelaps mercedesae]|uniref:Uncharacterized protein n=1 Tax=Tropilaelaps mercedesae TaxID=418985 RepID=A0A1V9X0R7_9ACAR|nr:hypothetical protein BIW11_13756 [Tropilaelaps mercedesae]